MAKILFLSFVTCIAIIFGVAALQSPTYRVERRAHVDAPPAVVFGYVNDLHKFQEWNPWSTIDPNATATFAGPAAGVGAAFAWSGNREVGSGTMTITESRPNDRVAMDLAFLTPMKGTSVAEFTLAPEGSGTAVTWAMSGRKNLMSKVMCLFMNMDRMIGGQFEKGLAALGRVAVAATPVA